MIVVVIIYCTNLPSSRHHILIFHFLPHFPLICLSDGSFQNERFLRSLSQTYSLQYFTLHFFMLSSDKNSQRWRKSRSRGFWRAKGKLKTAQTTWALCSAWSRWQTSLWSVWGRRIGQTARRRTRSLPVRYKPLRSSSHHRSIHHWLALPHSVCWKG